MIPANINNKFPNPFLINENYGIKIWLKDFFFFCSKTNPMMITFRQASVGCDIDVKYGHPVDRFFNPEFKLPDLLNKNYK